MSRHGKGQANVHPAAVMFDWGVHELMDAGELDNCFELLSDLCAGHSQDCPVQIHVLPAGQLLMKACANLQQTSDATVKVNLTFGGSRDAGKNLEQGAFARPVSSNDANELTFADLE